MLIQKRFMKNLLALTALLAMPALFTGCATTGKPDVAKICRIVKFSAQEGTSAWLLQKPDDRGKFQTARNSIQALIDTGTFEFSDLTAVLQKLPVKELKSGYGKVGIDVAIFVWNEYGEEVMALDQGAIFQTYILPVAKSLVAGFDAALGSPSAMLRRSLLLVAEITPIPPQQIIETETACDSTPGYEEASHNRRSAADRLRRR